MATGLPHRERRQAMISVAALAAIALSLGLYVVQSPPEDPVRREVARSARAVGRLIGVGGHARRPIGDLIRRAEQGDDNARAVAVLELRYETTDSARFAQVTPVLLRSLRDGSRSVQDAAMSVLGDLILRYGRYDASGRAPGASDGLQQGMVKLIEASRTDLRVFAINQLGTLARMRGLEEPPGWSPAWTTTPSPCEPPRLRPSSPTPAGPSGCSPWPCAGCRARGRSRPRH